MKPIFLPEWRPDAFRSDGIREIARSMSLRRCDIDVSRRGGCSPPVPDMELVAPDTDPRPEVDVFDPFRSDDDCRMKVDIRPDRRLVRL